MTLAQAIKSRAPESIIVIGGVHVTIEKERAMEACFDCGFAGDGEISLPQFLAWFKAGRDTASLGSIKGVLYRSDNEIVFTGMPDEVADLDELLQTKTDYSFLAQEIMNHGNP